MVKGNCSETHVPAHFNFFLWFCRSVVRWVWWRTPVACHVLGRVISCFQTLLPAFSAYPSWPCHYLVLDWGYGWPDELKLCYGLRLRRWWLFCLDFAILYVPIVRGFRLYQQDIAMLLTVGALLAVKDGLPSNTYWLFSNCGCIALFRDNSSRGVPATHEITCLPVPAVRRSYVNGTALWPWDFSRHTFRSWSPSVFWLSTVLTGDEIVLGKTAMSQWTFAPTCCTCTLMVPCLGHSLVGFQRRCTGAWWLSFGCNCRPFRWSAGGTLWWKNAWQQSWYIMSRRACSWNESLRPWGHESVFHDWKDPFATRVTDSRSVGTALVS